MRQFIDQQHLRVTRERRIQVELLQRAAPVGHVPQRQLCQTGQQLGSFGAAVGFNHADQNVATRFCFSLCRAEHSEGFANAGCGSQVNAQFAPALARLVLADLIEQLIGVGA